MIKLLILLAFFTGCSEAEANFKIGEIVNIHSSVVFPSKCLLWRIRERYGESDGYYLWYVGNNNNCPDLIYLQEMYIKKKSDRR